MVTWRSTAPSTTWPAVAGRSRGVHRQLHPGGGLETRGAGRRRAERWARLTGRRRVGIVMATTTKVVGPGRRRWAFREHNAACGALVPVAHRPRAGSARAITSSSWGAVRRAPRAIAGERAGGDRLAPPSAAGQRAPCTCRSRLSAGCGARTRMPQPPCAPDSTRGLRLAAGRPARSPGRGIGVEPDEHAIPIPDTACPRRACLPGLDPLRWVANEGKMDRLFADLAH